MEGEQKFLMVAALDFGTTYSGYAFSMIDEFKNDPLKIHANTSWNAGARALSSIKTPTVLLLNADKEFVAFGYDAENEYANIFLEENVQHEDYYYFHRFKMNLHNNKNITHSMLLEDITGKKLPAIEVFKLSIKALVDHLLKMLENRSTYVGIGDIRWVLTVPSIWTDTAKSFMRTSAEEAGIPPKNLLLALEPETASIYCQYLPIEKLKGSELGFTMTSAGTKYMVVDIGGGTADITVHQKASVDQLLEICRATGNDCGGTSVDKRFLDLFDDMLGKNFITEFKNNDPLGYLDLVREFEAVKRNMDPEKQGKVNMTIPVVSLEEQCQKLLNKDMKSLIGSSGFSNDVNVARDKLRLNADKMRDFFVNTIMEILQLIKVTLRKPEAGDVTKLLMVGGFSECRLIQEAIKNAFPDKRIIVPEDAGMAVLKGAVLFGHRPNYIKSRVMRVTYGVKVNHPFDARKHDEKHKVKMGDDDRCDNIFSVIVHKDEPIEAGTKIKKSFLTPYPNQEIMDFIIYTSDNPNPSYIDDEGCGFLCKPTINFPDVCEERRWVDVEFVFGDTEIGMKAVDRNSGLEITSKINMI